MDDLVREMERTKSGWWVSYNPNPGQQDDESKACGVPAAADFYTVGIVVDVENEVLGTGPTLEVALRNALQTYRG